MYSFKNIFTKSPEEVKVAILAIIGVILALGTDVDPSLLETVGAGIALERFLNLVYVAPTQRANVDTIAMQGVALGKQLATGSATVMESSGAKNKQPESGQANLPVLLIVLAVICAVVGLWTAAKFLVVVAAVIVVVALVVGSRSRV